MQRLEILSWSSGIILILAFFGVHALGEIERQRYVEAFAVARASDESGTSMDPIEPAKPTGEDVLAILRIANIELELPVRFGTDERALRKGPGLIEGTSLPGSNGNIGIAAHRDIHFRGLKNLELGDVIELDLPDKTQTYVVTSLSVVEPEDIQVLDEIGKPVLTLVTCFPFYFVGNAPKRFIVRAEAVEFSH